MVVIFSEFVFLQNVDVFYCYEMFVYGPMEHKTRIILISK